MPEKTRSCRFGCGILMMSLCGQLAANPQVDCGVPPSASQPPASVYRSFRRLSQPSLSAESSHTSAPRRPNRDMAPPPPTIRWRSTPDAGAETGSIRRIRLDVTEGECADCRDQCRPRDVSPRRRPKSRTDPFAAARRTPATSGRSRTTSDVAAPACADHRERRQPANHLGATDRTCPRRRGSRHPKADRAQTRARRRGPNGCVRTNTDSNLTRPQRWTPRRTRRPCKPPDPASPRACLRCRTNSRGPRVFTTNPRRPPNAVSLPQSRPTQRWCDSTIRTSDASPSGTRLRARNVGFAWTFLTAIAESRRCPTRCVPSSTATRNRRTSLMTTSVTWTKRGSNRSHHVGPPTSMPIRSRKFCTTRSTRILPRKPRSANASGSAPAGGANPRGNASGGNGNRNRQTLWAPCVSSGPTNQP